MDGVQPALILEATQQKNADSKQSGITLVSILIANRNYLQRKSAPVSDIFSTFDSLVGR